MWPTWHIQWIVCRSRCWRQGRATVQRDPQAEDPPPDPQWTQDAKFTPAWRQSLRDIYHFAKASSEKNQLPACPTLGHTETWNSQSRPPPASEGVAVSQLELPHRNGPVRRPPPTPSAGPSCGPSMTSPVHWAFGHGFGAEATTHPPTSEPCFS